MRMMRIMVALIRLVVVLFVCFIRVFLAVLALAAPGSARQWYSPDEEPPEPDERRYSPVSWERDGYTYERLPDDLR